MKAEILSIGDELLIGQVINTNAAKIGELLNLAGISVIQASAIADSKTAIIEALNAAKKRSELIILTGGLGPTKDDITKLTLTEFFNTRLASNAEVLKDVSSWFLRRGKEVNEVNKKQAEVPENCEVIRNKNGTAPGMWFAHEGKVIISMPGVPYETIAMMESFVIPKLQNDFNLPSIFHKTILTLGIGESYLAEKIEAWENSLAEKNIKLAYLPSVGAVRLRLSGFGKNKAETKKNVEAKVEEVLPLIKKYVYGFEEFGKPAPKIETVLAGMLLEKNKKIALAESCTGGYISHLLTSIPGSSEWFNGAIVPYHNSFKHDLLAVDEEIFIKAGAVSKECVLQMAKGCLQKFNSDYAVAVSGIAGPTGGTDEKPVGLVWIAWANKKECRAEKFIFGNDRGRNIHTTAITALNGLRKLMLENF
jgi:nicotinamide-nucleotide amidase